MKKVIGLLVVMVILVSGLTMAAGLRLGIGIYDNYPSGARIAEVFQGYPAYGYLFPGDLIMSIGYYYGNVAIYYGYATMGNARVSTANPSGTTIYNASQCQSMIMNAPYNCTVAIWVNRNGNYQLIIIQLLDPNNGYGGGNLPPYGGNPPVTICSVP